MTHFPVARSTPAVDPNILAVFEQLGLGSEQARRDLLRQLQVEEVQLEVPSPHLCIERYETTEHDHG